VIQDGAVGATGTGNWAYVTSAETGDRAELVVDVFGDVQTGANQDIVLWLRTVEADLDDGIEVLWAISPNTNAVQVDRIDLPFAFVELPAPVSPGLHSFEAEITASNQIEVTIDGALVLAAPLGTVPPPGRTGLGFFRTGTPSVRITSFVARTGALRSRWTVTLRFPFAAIPSAVLQGLAPGQARI